MKIQVSKTMLMTLFTGALATLVSSVRAANFTTVEWKGAVTSGVYTNDANWTGDVAPKDGILGYFNNVTGNPDIALDFTGGVSENSSTWMRVPNSTTATRTITLDASNGGWWEKPAYDYSANASDINYVGLIFGDSASTPKSTMFAMMRSATTDFTKTLFRMTNAVIRFGGNKTLMQLEFAGGPIDFWNPSGEVDPQVTARPSILSGGGSQGPHRITFKDDSAVSMGAWTARAEGGDSSIVFEGGTHSIAGWTVLDSASVANRLDVSVLGGAIAVDEALSICAGDKSHSGQRADFVVSNAVLAVAGSFNPACGVTDESVVMTIGGASAVSVGTGMNVSVPAAGNNPSGCESTIEVAGTSVFTLNGPNPILGRHAGGTQIFRVREQGRFVCGSSDTTSLLVGYNDRYSNATTGILELVDHAYCGMRGCTVGYTSAASYPSYGHVSLSDQSAFVVPTTVDINVGSTSKSSGEGLFEVFDDAVVTGRYFVVGSVGKGTLALKGGVAAVSKIYGKANGTLIADGGTFDVQASGKTMYDFGAAKLGAKGLVYASANKTTNISQAFEDLDGGTDGLFAKTGTGALTVNANSTHAKTEIRGGSIVFGSGVTSFGRNLILSKGATVDASADGLTVDTLTAASDATLKVTAGKPIRVTAADGLLLGDGVKISLANATTEGTFTLFETETPVTAADLEKIKVVNADYGYIYTLAADGKNVKLVTEYHEPQEVSWNGSVSGGWMMADNWNGGKLPYPNDTAVFPAAAETKDVVADGDVRVAALSFPDVATYSLGGTGSVKGDVEVAGGKVSLVAPSVLAGEGELCLKKGTFVGAADGLSFVRDVTIDANRMPVGLKADEDVSITGSLSVKSGMIVKLGDATVTMNLPEGTHTVAPVDGSTVPAIGNVVTSVFEYDRESGEFASKGGLTAFNIVEGELGFIGAGASRTIINNSRVTAIGIRGGETASPSLSLRALTYNGGLDGSRTVVGTYYTNAVAKPPALALSDGAVLNASEFVVAYMASSSGRFYVSVTNSVLSASTSLQLPYEGTSNDDNRRAVVTVDGADAMIEYAATQTGSGVNGVVLGPVGLRLTDGAKLLARGTRPVRYSDHVRHGASVLVASGATFSAPALLGVNVFQYHSGVTNTFDGGTLELTSSATSLFANPEENVMVVGPNGATVSVGEGLTHRLAFPVVGAGELVKSGAGTLVLGKTLDWQSDAVTNECDAVVLRTTGAVDIAEGALDFAGESVSLVLKPSQGEIRNATLAGVRVDLAGLTPEIGQRIPVVRLGSGVTANLGTWRLATRNPNYSACFVREGDTVVAEIVTKPGLMMIVR